MVDPNRKINHLTEEDVEFLRECEEEFQHRYTENDEDFKKCLEKQLSTPPIVHPWMDRHSGGNFHRGGGGGRNNRYGGRGGGNQPYNNYRNRGPNRDEDGSYRRNNQHNNGSHGSNYNRNYDNTQYRRQNNSY